MSKRSKCCIIGIPDHQGVIHVGGRVGAASGPEAFRDIFLKMRGRVSIQNILKDVLIDAGNVTDLGTDVEHNHRQAADMIKKYQSESGLSIVIGGGHDHGYSHLMGISEYLKNDSSRHRLGCINIDAHLDVRKPAPLITSGSPFYLAVESGILDPRRFIEFGIQSHCNSPELWDYAKAKKLQTVHFQDLRRGKAVSVFKSKLEKLASICDAIVISLDLDALASAFSPGVSAPQAEGFTSMEIIEMMQLAGSQRKVVSLGIFELNPNHDEGQRSARLAAKVAYDFVEAALF